VVNIVTTHPNAAAKASRHSQLKAMLNERRVELVNQVQDRKRDARTDNFKEREVLDEGESAEADVQEEMEFALIEMKAEILNKIILALQRLEQGSYGSCLECGEDIPEARLRALPFAVRCRSCEERCETAQRLERIMAQRRESSALFQVSR
jgi:DnaK suppressor protein